MIKDSLTYVLGSTAMAGGAVATTTTNETTFAWGLLFGAIGAVGVIVQIINSTISTRSIRRTEKLTREAIENK